MKYLNLDQVRLLRRTVRDQALAANAKQQVTAIREWAAIDILTSSGIRVSECADLRCGDCRTGYGQSELFIRNGKGSKSRTVQIPQSLKSHLRGFLKWKQDQGEPTGENDFLFIGQRGPWTSQAVQQVVKKYLRKLALYERGKSCHTLRHSYACEYYRRGRDLRGLQKQLGHSSISTTQIYADGSNEDIQREIAGLWN